MIFPLKNFTNFTRICFVSSTFYEILCYENFPKTSFRTSPGGQREAGYEIPLSEVVYDFFDKLKSYTKGYASLDYELCGYRTSNLVKMNILLNK